MEHQLASALAMLSCREEGGNYERFIEPNIRRGAVDARRDSRQARASVADLPLTATTRGTHTIIPPLGGAQPKASLTSSHGRANRSRAFARSS